MSALHGRPLDADFFARDVVEVSRQLVACVVTFGVTVSRIVETEAYHQREPACHAYTGLTPRTRTLFGPPGQAYVYRSYGIHAMLNAVSESEGVGAAALIRSLEPLEGLQGMRARRGLERETDLCSGPGKLTQALGLWLDLDDTDLTGSGPITFHAPPEGAEPPVIAVGPRIGVTKAVDLPWRFGEAGNRHMSRPILR